MLIRELFEKDINRNINGVIKVDQQMEEEVFQELEEFVITDELRRHFNDFFKAYLACIDNKNEKMAVWISGFFGSGKSHLLKMLSYLLENREAKGKKAIDFFRGKITDHILFAEMERASRYPADVVLFNIDSKSSAESKKTKMAIVDVFMKVFNEKLGYCGDVPWLAEIERMLDEEGKFEAFKQAYIDILGEGWEESRTKIYFIRDHFVEAVRKVKPELSEEAAGQMFDRAESNYTLSPEKFAKLVTKYLDSKGQKHNIIFFIDEVGQYVGGNEDLMLNLQTVTEDLGTYCRGRAWVVVTSQEAIDSITKERFRDRDFSKIQGRFDTRLNLSSSNTDEVIKKRLLSKQGFAKDSLRVEYSQKAPILKNLISFSAKAAGMLSYQNESEFVDSYPFIPYQFELLQKVFENIRKFSHAGKHLAEGERSMLNAFHIALKAKGEADTGILVSFSEFYDTVQSFLDSNIKRIFDKVKLNTNLELFDAEVLKVLFMIKYIKEVKADIENIATLMISHVDENKIALRNKINASLTRLKGEVLIQQNGDEYDFLTDEEQDVRRGIKNVQIDYAEIIREIGRGIYDEVYTEKSYKYSKFTSYNITRKINEHVIGKTFDDITISILTPDNSENSGDSAMKLKSAGGGTLYVCLPQHEKQYIEEMDEILKTEEYIRKKSDIKSTDSVRRIIDNKQSEIGTRKKRILQFYEKALMQADYYASGNKLNIPAQISSEKIGKALKILVENTYLKLNLVQSHFSEEIHIKNALRGNIQTMIGGGNSKAEEDVIVFLEHKYDLNLNSTMKEIKDRYSKAPYGWGPMDIAGVVASLFHDRKIRLELSGENLEPGDARVSAILLKDKDYDKLLVKFRKQVDQKLIDNALALGRKFFAVFDLPDDDDDALVKSFRDNVISDFIDKLRDMEKDYYYKDSPYPGGNSLGELLTFLKEIRQLKDTNSFLNELYNTRNDLERYMDGMKPVKDFFAGTQKSIFDQGLRCLKIYDEEKYYLQGGPIDSIISKLKAIVENQSPYSEIKDIPPLKHQFEEERKALLRQEKDKILKSIQNDWLVVEGEINKHSLKKDFIDKIHSIFTGLEKQVVDTDNFHLEKYRDQSEKLKYQCVRLIEEELRKQAPPVKPVPASIPETMGETVTPVGKCSEDKTEITEVKTVTPSVPSTASAPPPKKTVKINPVKVAGSKQVLDTEQDVDEYLKALREKLMEAIRNNNKVILTKLD